MKILSIIHYPHFGGPMNRNAKLAPILKGAGVQLEVVLPDEEGSAASRLREAGVSLHTMPLHRFRASRDPRVNLGIAAQMRSDVRRLRGLIRALEVDRILINGLHNPQGALAGYLEEVPVIWQLLDTFGPSVARGILSPIVIDLSQVVMSTGYMVAAAHPGVGHLGDRLVTFLPPVDTELFRPDPAIRVRARDELNIGESELVVGCVANLNPMKGHRWFMRALALLRRRGTNARGVILGASYPWRREYEDYLCQEAAALDLTIGDDLIISDPGSRVADLAPAFDVFWLTSEPRSEGVPTTVGEAMALGLPVVAVDVGAVREVISDGETGWVVPACEPEALVARTEELFRSPRHAELLGQNARAWSAANFSIDACAARHLAAFRLAGSAIQA